MWIIYLFYWSASSETFAYILGIFECRCIIIIQSWNTAGKPSCLWLQVFFFFLGAVSRRDVLTCYGKCGFTTAQILFKGHFIFHSLSLILICKAIMSTCHSTSDFRIIPDLKRPFMLIFSKLILSCWSHRMQKESQFYFRPVHLSLISMQKEVELEVHVTSQFGAACSLQLPVC